MISVSIPAYNEEKTLHLCLDSVVNQTIKEPFEVIVVDNNSTDNTATIIQNYAKKHSNVRYVLEKQKGCGAARARGFEEARGTYFFTTDADTVVPPNWLEIMLPPLKKKDVAAVTSLSTIDDTSWIKRGIFVIASNIALYAHKIALGHFWLSGFNYGIRKDMYIKSGKINKDLPMLDDAELSGRVDKHGKIVLVRNVTIVGSSRRYNDGLVKGLISYLKPFFETTILGKKADMKDYR